MTSPLARFVFGLAIAALAVCGPVADGKAESAPAAAGANLAVPPLRGTPPYEAGLLRLSEILGSVQYLRSLCDPTAGSSWRQSMQDLLDSETHEEPERREKLTAGYNRGYRAFAAVYTDCSASAVAAEARYRREGATLAAEIIARYGN